AADLIDKSQFDGHEEHLRQLFPRPERRSWHDGAAEPFLRFPLRGARSGPKRFDARRPVERLTSQVPVAIHDKIDGVAFLHFDPRDAHGALAVVDRPEAEGADAAGNNMAANAIARFGWMLEHAGDRHGAIDRRDPAAHNGIFWTF